MYVLENEQKSSLDPQDHYWNRFPHIPMSNHYATERI